MKKPLTLVFLFLSIISLAQPKLELTSNGFAAIEFDLPNRPVTELLQIAKGWAATGTEKRADVYNITENSLSIDAFRENAYYYLNRGETYTFDIKYTLTAAFREDRTCRVTFTVKEIYDNENLLKITVGDFFAHDGRLKEDYEEVKPSLEDTANKIVRSFAGNFLVD